MWVNQGFHFFKDHHQNESTAGADASVDVSKQQHKVLANGHMMSILILLHAGKLKEWEMIYHDYR